MYQKYFAGMVLQLARLIILIALDVASRKICIEEHGKNITINCFSHLYVTSSINSKWTVLVQFLQSAPLTMLGIGGIEFLASQTPYSMRRLFPLSLITSTQYEVYICLSNEHIFTERY